MQTETTKLKPRARDWESHHFVEAVREHYGYDLAGYDPKALKLYLKKCIRKLKDESFSMFQDRVLKDEKALHPLLHDLFSKKINKTFSEPRFKAQVQKWILPMLRTYPRFKVWQMGCVPEELTTTVLSLLKKNKIAERAQIYATDINEYEVNEARKHYLKRCLVKEEKKVSFFPHNFLSDSTFNEFQWVLVAHCVSNLGGQAREKVMGLLHDSIAHLGFLICPEKSLIEESSYKTYYKNLDSGLGLYQRRN